MKKIVKLVNKIARDCGKYLKSTNIEHMLMMQNMLGLHDLKKQTSAINWCKMLRAPKATAIHNAIVKQNYFEDWKIEKL